MQKKYSPSIEKRISVELYDDRSTRWETSFRLSSLKTLYPRLFNCNSSLGIFDFQIASGVYTLPTLDVLVARYGSATTLRSISHRKIVEKTFAEIELYKAITSFSQTQVCPSVWIGNKNIDLFMPTLEGFVIGKGRRFHGVAIEVDGGVHNLRSKSYKDNDKEEFLHWMDILTIRIQNTQVLTKNALESLFQSYYFRPADTRAKRRMWKKIYLVTLFLGSSEEELEELFGCNFNHLRKNFHRALTEKKPCL